jgi:leucyl-tRNA synthetase
MHLLYTRFFTKAMRDLGMVTFGEPMLRLFNQGVILGEDGEKMSKSRGNVVDPDEQIAKHGADVVRAYLMFMRPWGEGGPWSSRDIEGVARFLRRVWDLIGGADIRHLTSDINPSDLDSLARHTHQTIKRVTEDFETFGFNTAIAALMEFVNYMYRVRGVAAGSDAWQDAIRPLLLMLAPVAPHMAEELWERIGEAYSVHTQPWPAYDPDLARSPEITLVVQVNGRVRDRLTVPADITADAARDLALRSEKVRAYIDGSNVRDVIYVPGRLVNVVVE